MRLRTALALALAGVLAATLGAASDARADRSDRERPRKPRVLVDADVEGQADEDEDKRGNDDGGKEPDPKKTPEWKELTAIGKEFKAANVKALIARVPRKGVTLRLGKQPDTYKPKQASGWLKQWFKGRRLKKVELEKMNGLTGDFALHMELTKRGELKKKRLLITLEKKGEAFRLTKIQVI